MRLRKVQEQCCYEPVPAKGKKNDQPFDFGEEDFNTEFNRCAIRVLGVKRTEAAGDRVVRFLGLFLKTASEKDIAIFTQDGAADETQSFPETPTSRLTFSLLSIFIPLLSAKEKTVRFRATQTTSHIVNALDSIDDELYHLIRQGLIKRIRDKEPTIRIQAVLGLGRLAGNEIENGPQQEDDDEDDLDTSGLVDKLLDVLQNDTSAEVRRSLLLNLPLTPTTLPFLLERARDLDGPTRRALYARLLPTLGDFRHLSLSMREKLLRWGLRDRDENVRKAAGRLFRERWIEDCAGNRDEEGNKPQEIVPASATALLELLERIDIVNSGVEDGIALEAMKEFWEGRPDYLDAMVFDDDFFNSLTSESAFMVRSFNDFCQQGGRYQGLAEEKMPEVTKLGFYLQKYINVLLEGVKKAAESDDVNEEETVELEFVVEQLLYIALDLDYSDEVGRRKMFSLLREALAMADLPEEVTRLTIEVLRLVCGTDAAGEREFCAIVLEAIAEVHDNIVTDNDVPADEDESFVSARSEVSDDASTSSGKKSSSTKTTSSMSQLDSQTAAEDDSKAVHEIMINLKCLHIAHCMLQNVQGSLQTNISLVTMLNNLVVPAVRSHEAPIRERGILCLGLCCLLDRTLAEENITLFIHCFAKGHEALQVTSLRILCDVLVTWPTLLSASEDDESHSPPAHQKPLLKAFTRALKPTSPLPIQSASALSLAKLLLTSRLHLPSPSLSSLLSALAISYFSPATADNPVLRQALAYFLPVYCHSTVGNCARMAECAVGIVREVMRVADEFFSLEVEEDSDGEVDERKEEKEVKGLMGRVVGVVGGEWTDGRRVVNFNSNLSTGVGGEVAGNTDAEAQNVQLGLAASVLDRVLATGCHAREKKVLLTLLGKLYLPPPSATGGGIPEEQRELAARVKELVQEAMEEGVAVDAAGKNTLVKVKNAVLKLGVVVGKEGGSARGRGSGRKSVVEMVVRGGRGGGRDNEGKGTGTSEEDGDGDGEVDLEDSRGTGTGTEDGQDVGVGVGVGEEQEAEAEAAAEDELL